MKVTLTPMEVDLAERIGTARQDVWVKDGRKDPKCLDDGYAIHVQGVKAEIALARALGITFVPEFLSVQEWEKVRYTLRDVGQYEVRSTARPDGRLIIKKWDKDDAPYVLVIVDGLSFNLVGWLLGREAKKEKYFWKGRYGMPSYYVPQSDLNPMDTLPRG